MSYRIYRGGSFIGTSTATTAYTDSGLTADTAYAYTVSAVNAQGIEGPQSESVTGRTAVVGGNNPDSLSAATTTWLSRDYETQVAAHVANDNPQLAVSTWGAAYGFGGTGGWRSTYSYPVGNGVEDNCGWGISGTDDTYPSAPPACTVFTMSYLLYVTQEFMDQIVAGCEFKSADMNAFTGSRYVTFFRFENVFDSATGVGPGVFLSPTNGGAGTVYWWRAGNVDWRTLVNQWVWVSQYYDGPNRTMRIYIKPQGAGSVTKIGDWTGTISWLRDTVAGRYADGSDTLGDASTGFNLDGNARSLFGYWDDWWLATGAPGPNNYIAIDRLRIANGWIDPPF